MKLIQMLQEASSLAIQDLKKAMSKDKRTAVLLKKDLSLSDIEDKEAFLSTVKYYIFNNDNVRSFVAARSLVKDISQSEFDEFRKLRANELTEEKLQWLSRLVGIIFKEHTATEKATLSADLKKLLRDWINTSGYSHNLPGWAERELMSIPSIRPSKKVVLYRGVLFSEYSLKQREKYDGTLEVGQGLKFLKTIRKGGKQVDLDWDKPSSWTTNKEVAQRFAKFGPASSHAAAMIGWLSRGDKFIDGSLGFVVSTLADPKDILVDLDRLPNLSGLKHDGEHEVILKAGTYLSNIVHKYTVKGEVDPAASTAGMSESVSKALDDIAKFKDEFDVPEQLTLVKELENAGVNMWSSSALPVVRDFGVFKKLILNGTTTAAVHSYDKLMQFYKKSLSEISDDDLAPEKFADNDELSKRIQNLKNNLDRFRRTVKHSKFKSDKNSRAEGKRHDLTGEEFRTTISASDVSKIEKDLLTSGRIVDSDASRDFSYLCKILDVKLPTSARLAQFGAAKQAPIIDEVLKKFYSVVGVTQPAEKTEAIKTMLTLIKKAHRNFIMLEMVDDMFTAFKEL